MTNHTGTVRACQYHAHPPKGETLPSPSSTPPTASTVPDTTDRQLVQRYGVALLTGGYTALPTYAWVYYARLGVSEAEMVLIAQLCTYWWNTRDPYPGEAALAARMGKTVRTIQGYLRSLEGKGLLHIETRLSNSGQQHTNTYDLRPFFRAVEGLARLDGLRDDATPAGGATPGSLSSSPRADNSRGHQACLVSDTNACNCGPSDPNKDMDGDAEREPLCAGAPRSGIDNRPTGGGTPAVEGGEGSHTGGVKDSSPQVNPIEINTFDYDSIPPTPVNKQLGPTAGNTPTDQALTREIAALSVELGDNAPVSSVTRARNLCHDAGVSPARFLHLLDEAADRTRDRQAGIVKRRRDGQAPNGMPYLFAVLQDLLHPAATRAHMADAGPDRRRTERPGRRRRRRADGRGEVVDSYAAWSDSPERLPIVEEHPVWRAVLDELAQVMTPENFNAWLASTRALDQEGEVLRVAVPAAFNKTWLEHKLAGKVMGALQKIDYDGLGIERVGRVEYVVDAAACVPTEATARAS